jgi:hypothetical protein
MVPRSEANRERQNRARNGLWARAEGVLNRQQRKASFAAKPDRKSLEWLAERWREKEVNTMYANRLVAAALVVPLLVVGLMVAAPQPARADNDLGWLLGGITLGAILSGGHHYTYYGPPVIAGAYYYPGPRVYVVPETYAGPRFWVARGETWRGRAVLVPVRRPRLWGDRIAVTFGPRRGPVFRVAR